MKNAKACLDHYSLIQYYRRRPEFMTQQAHNALIIDSRNLEASCFWEVQLRVAVQDDSLCFLFENKGSQYDGEGFKILAALNQHCPPDSVANFFTTLMLLFNDSMTGPEKIMAFCSSFDGLVNNMGWCKITIPPIHLVMFFLCALHPRYKNLLGQFPSRYKSLESASLILLWWTYAIMTISSWLVQITRRLLPGKHLVLPRLLQTWTSRGKSRITCLSGFPRFNSTVSKRGGGGPLRVMGSVTSAITWTTNKSQQISLFSRT
jgi:hypothetical protein